MTKFKVGDKVRILDVSGIAVAGLDGWSNGDIAEVVSIARSGSPLIEGKKTPSPLIIAKRELPYIELVSDKPTKNQRITTLESEVAELKAKVEALEKAQKPSLVYEGSAQFINGERVIKVAPTYNEQRKAIIAEAKAFVEKLTQVKNGDLSPLTQRVGSVRIKFEVNPEKRVVEALGKLAHVPDKYGRYKAIAKCAPDDVFNADIGKAIALGRALGLDVSRFEQAVKPTVFAVGQIVSSRRDKHSYKVVPDFRVDNEVLSVKHCKRYFTELQIIDDTEAVY